MPPRREQIAAVLHGLGEKADLRRRFERMTSLDQPQDADAVDMALEMGGSLVPGVGQVLAARDFERARRADDKAGMAMAAASAIPVNRLIGALKGFDPVMREINVYHGSPHRFEEFDASKIGTGEGAQAYGHGIYLAESPDVAKTYKAANDPIARKAEELLRSTDGDVDRAMRYAKKKVEDLEKNRDVKGFFSPVALEQNQGALNYLRQMKKGKPPQVGSMYTADLPDEMVDRMLDWDKPLTAQSKNVQQVLAKLGDPQETLDAYDDALLKALFENAPDPGATPRNPLGSEIVSKLEKRYGRAGASEYLKSLGIPGIRYLDAGSRGQGGTGTRNFVVFPGEEKKVKILKRE